MLKLEAMKLFMNLILLAAALAAARAGTEAELSNDALSFVNAAAGASAASLDASVDGEMRILVADAAGDSSTLGFSSSGRLTTSSVETNELRLATSGGGLPACDSSNLGTLAADPLDRGTLVCTSTSAGSKWRALQTGATADGTGSPSSPPGTTPSGTNCGGSRCGFQLHQVRVVGVVGRVLCACETPLSVGCGEQVVAALSSARWLEAMS
jgi:hypothetical protein